LLSGFPQTFHAAQKQDNSLMLDATTL